MGDAYFVYPAEFRDGMMLSAQQLNALSDAVTHVHGRAVGPSILRPTVVTDTELNSTNNIWRIRHMADHKYIHYSMEVYGSSLTGDVDIVLSTEDAVYSESFTVITNPVNGNSYSGYITTNGEINGHALNNGEWYQLYVDTPSGSSYTFEVHWLDESTATSLSYPTATGSSWSAMPYFSHGDAGGTALLQRYSDGLNYCYDIIGDAGRNPAVLVDREHGPLASVQEDSGLTFVHKYRWLIFRGSGEIVHPTDSTTNESEGLSDEDELTAFDLSNVSWLQYGDIYRVSGCTWACEANEAG